MDLQYCWLEFRQELCGSRQTDYFSGMRLEQSDKDGSKLNVALTDSSNSFLSTARAGPTIGNGFTVETQNSWRHVSGQSGLIVIPAVGTWSSVSEVNFPRRTVPLKCHNFS